MVHSSIYAVESESKVKGVTVFEMTLAKYNIRHIVGRVHHPLQTNGKIERFFRTVVEEKPNEFDSIDELIMWYNSKRPHMSLDMEKVETPDQAFIRKMPEDGVVIDKESGEVYHAKPS